MQEVTARLTVTSCISYFSSSGVFKGRCSSGFLVLSQLKRIRLVRESLERLYTLSIGSWQDGLVKFQNGNVSDPLDGCLLKITWLHLETDTRGKKSQKELFFPFATFQETL